MDTETEKLTELLVPALGYEGGVAADKLQH